MPRLPESRSIFRQRCPFEGPSPEFGCDLAKALRLLGDPRFAAMKFDKQHRRLRQCELRIGVARFNLQGVQEFDASDGKA